MGESLKRKVALGFVWNAIQMIVNRLSSFGVKLVLARILLPEDFGLVGLAVVFTGFINVLNDIGIGAALVQKKEDTLREEHSHTAFWTSVAWSILMYAVIVYFLSPAAAYFYGEPVLGIIVPALGLGVLASPFTTVPRAQLTRDLNFKTISHVTNFSSILSGGIAIVLALNGFGLWSLVMNGLLNLVFTAVLMMWSHPWRPKLIWTQGAFKDIFGFGLFTTATRLFNYLSNNFDYLIIGKMLSATALGPYTLAYLLTDTLKSQLMNIVSNVMYPVYGRKQDDTASLKRYFLMVVRYNALPIFPLMATFIIFGEEIVGICFGEKWLDAVLPLKILSIAVLFTTLTNSVSSLIRGMGHPDLEFKIQAFKSIFIYVPLIVIGVYFGGTAGAASAILANKIIFVMISQYFLKRLVGISYMDLVNAVRDPALGLILAVSITLLMSLVDGIPVLIKIAILFIVYLTVEFLIMRDEIVDLRKHVGRARTA
jgi:teichuronic acid exporter